MSIRYINEINEGKKDLNKSTSNSIEAEKKEDYIHIFDIHKDKCHNTHNITNKDKYNKSINRITKFRTKYFKSNDNMCSSVKYNNP